MNATQTGKCVEWTISGPGSDGGWYAVRSKPVLRAGPFRTKGEAAKQAELLNKTEAMSAAAPALLAACKWLMRAIEQWPGLKLEDLDTEKIAAAIDLAEPPNPAATA